LIAPSRPRAIAALTLGVLIVSATTASFGQSSPGSRYEIRNGSGIGRYEFQPPGSTAGSPVGIGSGLGDDAGRRGISGVGVGAGSSRIVPPVSGVGVGAGTSLSPTPAARNCAEGDPCMANPTPGYGR